MANEVAMLQVANGNYISI